MNQVKVRGTGGLRSPQPTECLSSYLAAWRGSRGESMAFFINRVNRIDSAVAMALVTDPDFPDHPSWVDVLFRATKIDPDVLRELGTRLGPWHLLPRARVHACIACIEEAGGASYQWRSKLWIYSTITICPWHDLPLLEMPAVGWEWSELSAGKRKSHANLILKPWEIRLHIERHWRALDENIRQAIFFAEMSAWSGSAPSSIGVHIGYAECSDDRSLWEDMLSLLVGTWSRELTYPIALYGMPPEAWDAGSRQYLGYLPKQYSPNPPTIGVFCGTKSAALRRACLLVAADAIRRDVMVRYLSSLRWERCGWRRVIEEMPDEAYGWIHAAVSDWPEHRKEIVSRWPFRARQRSL